MESVTISSKYQIVIPRSVREGLKIRPGGKLVIIQKEGHIHMFPVGPIMSSRGIAKGATSQGVREKRDRL